MRVSEEVTAFLKSVPRKDRPAILALRRLVLRCAPGAEEAVRFHSLCYFRPLRPFGCIGGNICMIEAGRQGVRLSFLHGASLPDPGAVLMGRAAAKRFVPIRSSVDWRRHEVPELIRASARAAEGKTPRHDRSRGRPQPLTQLRGRAER